MDVGSIRRCVAGIVLALAAVGLGLPSVDAAEKESKALSARVTAIDFNECVPFQVRAQIMDLHSANRTIVVAEREIRVLDVDAEGQPIKTEFLTLDGKPESPSAFGVGQYVWVKGVLHPDGFVAAFVVQKIAKPQDEKFIYKPNAKTQAKARRAGRRLAAAPAAGSN
jgi:hypothetical protein